MLHELKEIIHSFEKANAKGISCALVSVVALNGSSYRKPGVRMLVDSYGTMTGAVSGGCVEKEIVRQAQTVFSTNKSVIMTYDGRYRLGCEGMIYLLIEPFHPNTDFLNAFNSVIENRTSVEVNSYYNSEIGTHSDLATEFIFEEQAHFANNLKINKTNSCFKQTPPPCFRLYIAGIEHDAKHLCRQASFLGWEVIILKNHDQMQGIKEFPGATDVLSFIPEDFNQLPIDTQTGMVLMSHNFAKDLNSLLHLSRSPYPAYIGVLGSTKRMEQLLSGILDRNADVSEEFMDLIHGPAGLNIHAITPQEIAVSIVAEIIEIQRSLPKSELHTKSVSTYES